MKRRAPILSAAVFLLAVPTFAQEQAREVRADALFREAKQLIEQRRYDEACPKLAESQELDPAGGTALTLALCHQAAGRLATAVRGFEEALTFAERDGRPDRVKVARAGIAKLTPLASRLLVHVDARSAELAELRVERDGERLETSAFDVALPVDGGSHSLIASAPGHQRFELTFTVSSQEERRTVDVPWLEPIPQTADAGPPKPTLRAEPTRRPASAAAKQGSESLRTALTLASFGLALAGGATATYFGLHARSEDTEADARCPASPCSDAQGVQLNEDARRDAWIATAATGIGLASVLAGSALLLTWPHPAATQPTSSALGWSITWTGRAASVRGTF